MSPNTRERIAAAVILISGVYLLTSAFGSETALLYAIVAFVLFAMAISMICSQFAKNYLWSIGQISSKSSTQKSKFLNGLTLGDFSS